MPGSFFYRLVTHSILHIKKSQHGCKRWALYISYLLMKFILANFSRWKICILWLLPSNADWQLSYQKFCKLRTNRWVPNAGPTGPFWVLPVPTWVPNIWKLSFRGLLIYCDNFHFHCHGQFSLYKFSNTHPRTENSRIEVGRAHLKIFARKFLAKTCPNSPYSIIPQPL